MLTEIRTNESAAHFLQTLATRAKEDVSDAYRRGVLDAITVLSPAINVDGRGCSGLVCDLDMLLKAKGIKFSNFYSLSMIIHDAKRHRDAFMLHLDALLTFAKR